MQKIQLLQCLCTICLNIAKIIQKQPKSFDFKINITGKLEGSNTEKEAEIVVLLKQLNNFWRTLEMPLINCEINLILTWPEKYVK